MSERKMYRFRVSMRPFIASATGYSEHEAKDNIWSEIAPKVEIKTVESWPCAAPKKERKEDAEDEWREYYRKTGYGWAENTCEEVLGLINRGWTQERDAYDVNGDEVDPESDDAVAWSLFGALLASTDRHPLVETDFWYLVRTIGEKTGVGGRTGPTVWNDDPRRTRKDVVELLENLIAHFQKLEERRIDERSRHGAG